MLDLTRYGYDQLSAIEDMLEDLLNDRHVRCASGDDVRAWLHREFLRTNRAICATLDIMAEEWDHRQEEKK